MLMLSRAAHRLSCRSVLAGLLAPALPFIFSLVLSFVSLCSPGCSRPLLFIVSVVLPFIVVLYEHHVRRSAAGRRRVHLCAPPGDAAFYCRG